MHITQRWAVNSRLLDHKGQLIRSDRCKDMLVCDREAGRRCSKDSKRCSLPSPHTHQISLHNLSRSQNMTLHAVIHRKIPVKVVTRYLWRTISCSPSAMKYRQALHDTYAGYKDNINTRQITLTAVFMLLSYSRYLPYSFTFINVRTKSCCKYNNFNKLLSSTISCFFSFSFLVCRRRTTRVWGCGHQRSLWWRASAQETRWKR